MTIKCGLVVIAVILCLIDLLQLTPNIQASMMNSYMLIKPYSCGFPICTSRKRIRKLHIPTTTQAEIVSSNCSYYDTETKFQQRVMTSNGNLQSSRMVTIVFYKVSRQQGKDELLV